MRIEPGTQIGRYEIQRKLGAGGMGTVYMGHDPMLGRMVAIKMVKADLDLADGGYHFAREAPSAALLNHPNIVAVYDFGEVDSQPYIVMEYVAGEALSQMIQRKAVVTIDDKLRWMEELCAGAAHAHRMSVIHRDIKPTHLMIDKSGRLKILDFGIARMAGTTTNTAPPPGTPGYMAPEQLRGEPLDQRADVFAIGAVFYEILSFAKAFPGDSPAAVIHRVLTVEPAPLRQVLAGGHPEIAAVCERALMKDRDQRFASADDMREAIGRVRRKLDPDAGLTTMRGLGMSVPGRDAGPAPPTRDTRSGGSDTPMRGLGRTDLEARRRQQLLEGALQEARGELQRGHVEQAMAACQDALAIDETHSEALYLKELIQKTVAAQANKPARDPFGDGAPTGGPFSSPSVSAPVPDALKARTTLGIPPPADEPWSVVPQQSEPRPSAATVTGDSGSWQTPTTVTSVPASAPRSSSLVTGILSFPMLLTDRIRTAAGKLGRAVVKLRARPHRARPATPSQSRVVDDPVLLGVSAPRNISPGATCTARFVAYIKRLEQTVDHRLRQLDADPVLGNRQTVVGLSPDRGGRWVIGAPVTVRVSGEHLRVEPPSHSFEWNGEENLVSFLVTVDKAASNDGTQLCFEAFIEGVPIAFIPLNLRIGNQIPGSDRVTATARPTSSAFASYASKDAAVVALLLSALKRWDPQADVFMDCLDLTPNDDWKHELERVIPTKDAFLLFWSANASQSPWVAWELQHARVTRGLEWIRPMPIEDPATTPPPDFLRHLHFRDRFLIARQAFLRLEER